VVVHSRSELAHRVQGSSQVVQHLGQKAGPLSCGAQGPLETLHPILETPEPAVKHAHREVQLTWTTSEELMINLLMNQLFY